MSNVESGRRTHRRIAPWFAAALGTICLVAAPAEAGRPKTDVIILLNGDTLHGEIKSMSSGKLQLKTDSMSTVDIEWDDIVEVTSAYEFEIEIQNGRNYYGSLEPGDDGQLKVVGEQATFELAYDRVVGVRPIRKEFWARIDGSLALGFSYTQSSEVTQLNFDFNSNYRTRKGSQSVSANSVITTTGGDSEDGTQRASLSYFYNRSLKKNRTFAQGFTGLQQNAELGLTLRVLVGATYGRAFVQTRHSKLALSLGLDVNRETPTGVEDPQNSLEGVFALQYNIYKWDTPKRILNLSLFAYPSLTIDNRIRTEFNSSFTQGITGDLDFVLTLFQSGDTDPPTADAQTTDWGVTTSVAWSF